VILANPNITVTANLQNQPNSCSGQENLEPCFALKVFKQTTGDHYFKIYVTLIHKLLIVKIVPGSPPRRGNIT
jgi:hypothetical protein